MSPRLAPVTVLRQLAWRQLRRLLTNLHTCVSRLAPARTATEEPPRPPALSRRPTPETVRVVARPVRVRCIPHCGAPTAADRQRADER